MANKCKVCKCFDKNGAIDSYGRQWGQCSLKIITPACGEEDGCTDNAYLVGLLNKNAEMQTKVCGLPKTCGNCFCLGGDGNGGEICLHDKFKVNSANEPPEECPLRMINNV